MYDNTRAHFSIIYILVLFAVAVACACTLGGEQRNLSTRQLPNTNVHGELEVSGIFRDTYSVQSSGFVDIPVDVGETTVLSIPWPRHTYIEAVGVTYGGAFTAATGTLTLNIKEGSTLIAGTTGNLIGGAGAATSADVERPLFYVSETKEFKIPKTITAATAADFGASSVPEVVATTTKIRNTGREKQLVVSAEVETGVLTASSSIRVAIKFADLRV